MMTKRFLNCFALILAGYLIYSAGFIEGLACAGYKFDLTIKPRRFGGWNVVEFPCKKPEDAPVIDDDTDTAS